MFTWNRVLGGALLAFALIGSQVARADDEKAVSLIVKPKVGRVMRTKGVINTSIMGMDLVANQSQTDTIKEVKDNGDVVTEITDEGSTFTVGGMEQVQPASPPYTFTHDKLGKIKEFRKAEDNGFMSPEIAKLMDSLTAFILTDKAVKTNDTWQTELENPAVKEKKITVKDTYLGLDKIEGKEYWKIKQTAEAIVDADGNKVSYEITEWVTPTDGETYKVEGTVKDVPTKAGALTMKMTSKSTKVDDKEKPAATKL
jgi:hypothetical protein